MALSFVFEGFDRLRDRFRREERRVSVAADKATNLAAARTRVDVLDRLANTGLSKEEAERRVTVRGAEVTIDGEWTPIEAYPGAWGRGGYRVRIGGEYGTVLIVSAFRRRDRPGEIWKRLPVAGLARDRPYIEELRWKRQEAGLVAQYPIARVRRGPSVPELLGDESQALPEQAREALRENFIEELSRT